MSVTAGAVAPPAKSRALARGGARRRRGGRLCCLALSLVAALACSATPGSASASVSTSAPARGVDARSAHLALTANRQFLRSLVAAAPARRAAAEAYVTSIAQTCPGVLSGLGPITLVSEKPAVRDVIAEGLGDLEVAVIAPGRRALATFARRTTSLRWSSPSTSNDVRNFFTAEDALYGAGPSNLCADLRALIADGGQTEPPQTSAWLERYQSLIGDAKTPARAFGRDLNRLSGPTDLPVIATTDLLEAKLQASEQRLLGINLNQLLAALGLPASVGVQ
jgi:hypothetical protein